MTQALYAHMNNKTIKKRFSPDCLCLVSDSKELYRKKAENIDGTMLADVLPTF
jgi:hypothetical protein